MPADHTVKFKRGSDPRNHIARCNCGYGYAGTYRAVRERADIHRTVFAHEYHPWNDRGRAAIMPWTDWRASTTNPA